MSFLYKGEYRFIAVVCCCNDKAVVILVVNNVIGCLFIRLSARCLTFYATFGAGCNSSHLTLTQRCTRLAPIEIIQESICILNGLLGSQLMIGRYGCWLKEVILTLRA